VSTTEYPPLRQMVEAMLMTVDEFGEDAETLSIHFDHLRAALATRGGNTNDSEDLKIMLARAANITEGTLARFAGDHWGPAETDYARRLITDLAAAAESGI